MSTLSAENLEQFINDYLKEDLKQLEHNINIYNEEIMEFVQLKNTIQTMKENLGESYKTQMNIGGNIFMEAKVDSMDKILIDVGKSCFVEFNLDEAIKFLNFKVAILTKECQVLRDESVKKRSDIKLALICINNEQQFTKVK